jgi:general secretion pathway protein A
MYYQYFGLSEAPFSIAVNPRYLYMSPRHRDALAHLLYGVGAGGGFILLTGEVGTGKTTLNRCLIEQLPDNADVAIVLNPALDSRDLLQSVCEELAIALPEAPTLKQLTDALHRFLIDNHGRGRKTVLMIDEAQHLDFAVLEQIRLLTNLETDDEKLLHIILIGQPELADKLARPELRQLNQRITARFDLQPLSGEETAAYVRHRLQVAGMPAGRELFSERLLRQVYRRSRGIPRLINLLCDRMLLGAYGRGAERPNRALLASAAREVLGDDGSSSRWRLFALAVLATIVVLAGLWSLFGPGQPLSRETPAAETAVAEAAPAATEATPAAAVAAPAVRPLQDARPAVEPWALAPAAGVRLLATLYDQPAAGDLPCALAPGSPLRCVAGEAATWDELQREGRPLLLALRDTRRFAARALFLGISGAQAVLADERGLRRVPVEQLAERWTGQFWFYWRPPAGWSGPLGEGDSGPAVAALASMFAALDGQARPLATQQYNAALAERVRLFQRARGLSVDGVAGEQTLRALLLAAGRDLDAVAARDLILARSVAGQWP